MNGFWSHEYVLSTQILKLSHSIFCFKRNALSPLHFLIPDMETLDHYSVSVLICFYRKNDLRIILLIFYVNLSKKVYPTAIKFYYWKNRLSKKCRRSNTINESMISGYDMTCSMKLWNCGLGFVRVK
jgi:hypothetical protein